MVSSEPGVLLERTVLVIVLSRRATPQLLFRADLTRDPLVFTHPIVQEPAVVLTKPFVIGGFVAL